MSHTAETNVPAAAHLKARKKEGHGDCCWRGSSTKRGERRRKRKETRNDHLIAPMSASSFFLSSCSVVGSWVLTPAATAAASDCFVASLYVHPMFSVARCVAAAPSSMIPDCKKTQNPKYEKRDRSRPCPTEIRPTSQVAAVRCLPFIHPSIEHSLACAPNASSGGDSK